MIIHRITKFRNPATGVCERLSFCVEYSVLLIYKRYIMDVDTNTISKEERFQFTCQKCDSDYSLEKDIIEKFGVLELIKAVKRRQIICCPCAKDLKKQISALPVWKKTKNKKKEVNNIMSDKKVSGCGVSHKCAICGESFTIPDFNEKYAWHKKAGLKCDPKHPNTFPCTGCLPICEQFRKGKDELGLPYNCECHKCPLNERRVIQTLNRAYFDGYGVKKCDGSYRIRINHGNFTPTDYVLEKGLDYNAYIDHYHITIIIKGYVKKEDLGKLFIEDVYTEMSLEEFMEKIQLIGNRLSNRLFLLKERGFGIWQSHLYFALKLIAHPTVILSKKGLFVFKDDNYLIAIAPWEDSNDPLIIALITEEEKNEEKP